MALSHLGVSQEVADIETENSQEAIALRRTKTTALEMTLMSAPWPFATAEADLTLVGEDPTDEWGYNYIYPPDCLSFRKIKSGHTTDVRSVRIPFRIVHGTNATEIYTNMEDAVGEYTVNVTNTNRMPVDFKLALSYMWAALSAAKLTGGDPYKLKNDMFSLANQTINKAKARMLNEQQDDVEPDTEYLTSRN